MWLTGRLAPDFKTIADFRHDNGAGIRNVCRRFVALCRELKLSPRRSSRSTAASSRRSTVATGTSRPARSKAQTADRGEHPALPRHSTPPTAPRAVTDDEVATAEALVARRLPSTRGLTLRDPGSAGWPSLLARKGLRLRAGHAGGARGTGGARQVTATRLAPSRMRPATTTRSRTGSRARSARRTPAHRRRAGSPRAAGCPSRG